MPSKIELKNIEELESMHTGSLMSRRRSLLKCEESIELSDQDAPQNPGMIEFKNTKEWQQAYKDLKLVLSERENIQSKKERKTIRQMAAKTKK